MSSTSRALLVDYRYSNYNTTTAAAVATVAGIITFFFSSVPFPSFPFSRISLLFSILSSSSSFFSFSPFRFNSSSSFFSFSLFHSLPIPPHTLPSSASSFPLSSPLTSLSLPCTHYSFGSVC